MASKASEFILQSSNGVAVIIPLVFKFFHLYLQDIFLIQFFRYLFLSEYIVWYGALEATCTINAKGGLRIRWAPSFDSAWQYALEAADAL